jgi:hypothetical protein
MAMIDVEDFERRMSKQLRFSISGPNSKYSGRWCAFSRDSDYYLGARSVVGRIKISLHASGICRIALTEHQIALMRAQGLELPNDRALTKWRRAASPDIGAAHVASLVFPTDHLQGGPPDATYKKPILIIGDGIPGKAVEVGIFFSREPIKTLATKLSVVGMPVCYTSLASGETVSMVVRQANFDPSGLPTSEMLSRAGMHLLDRDAVPDTEVSGLMAAFWNQPNDGGALHLVEIGGITLRRNKS